MTKEEAIERLKQNKAAAKFYAGMVQNTNAIENELKDIEAIDMAIEALQAKTDGDLISRADAIEAMGEEPPIWQDTAEEWAERNAWVLHVSALEALPSAENSNSKTQNSNQETQKSNGDLIYRADAVKVVRSVCDTESPIDCFSGEASPIDVEIIDELEALPSAETKTDEENELKFYYVESIDDYWVGRRLDNFYYANWHKGLGFVWSHSRYLPWGEHIVDENTLWKEHTYPSEPIEIPFTEWVVGFVKKYFTEPKTGEWIDVNGDGSLWRCSRCEDTACCNGNYCPTCGAQMKWGYDE